MSGKAPTYICPNCQSMGTIPFCCGKPLRSRHGVAVMSPALPAVYPMWQRRVGSDGAPYDDYCNDINQSVSIKATGPDGERTAADTAAEAQRVFANFALRLAS